MFKKIGLLIAVMCLIAAPSLAVQLQVNNANAGHFSVLNISRAGDTAVVGDTATIDLSTLEQTATGGAVEVIELSQLDVDQPFIKFSCTEGDTNCNSSYTSTNGSKVGSVLVDVNGTNRWIRTYEAPD